MSLTLSPELSARVLARSAAAGTTPEEMLDRALKLLDAHNVEGISAPATSDAARAETIRKLEEGLASLDRGEGIPKAKAFALLREELELMVGHAD